MINMSWRDIVKNQKPDYLDFDGDGDREEPMVDALETVEQVESTKKGFEVTNLSPPKKKKEVCPHCGQKTNESTKTSLIDRAKQANKENPRMGSGR